MEKVFDTRLLHRAIERGQVTRAEYEQYLASLEDSSTNADNVETSARELGPAFNPFGPGSEPAVEKKTGKKK